MTHADIEQMHAARQAMLRLVEADITSALYTTLAKKIQYERATLLELFESESRSVCAHRRANLVLNTQYFTQKRLDPNLIT